MIGSLQRRLEREGLWTTMPFSFLVDLPLIIVLLSLASVQFG